MEGSRRVYSEEFKKNVVTHSLTPEKTVAEVVYELGIHYSNMNRWCAQYEKKRRISFPRK